MPHVTFVTPDGAAVLLDVDIGQSLMHAALAAGVDGILGECGGALACGTCHVYVAEQFQPLLAPPSAEEQALLHYASARRDTSRLCCQIVMTEALRNLRLEVPAQQP